MGKGNFQPGHRAKLTLRLIHLGIIFSIALAACAQVSPAKTPLPGPTGQSVNPLPGNPTEPVPVTGDAQPSFPIRAAFFYPWFPEAWSQSNFKPFTNYQPSDGYYDSSQPSIIRSQIAAMQYANIQAGIASWWGQGTPTDQRFSQLLKATKGTTFRWAVYYEAAQKKPTADQIQSDLAYLRDHYGSDPSYLRVNGRFVVFVYNSADGGCTITDDWKKGNTVNAYLVLKVFQGYKNCASQPDSWHQYAPAKDTSSQGTDSFSISPGFWKKGEQTPRLNRDLNRWAQDVRAMIASDANFQLVVSFNEWGEGTAVESADQWQTGSGYGAYLDVLHDNGEGALAEIQGGTPTVPPVPTAAATGGAPLQSGSLDNKGSAVLLAAGDISSCSNPGDFATAHIIEQYPHAAVAGLGDTAYEDGSPEQFAQCYNPAWGPFKDRTHPAVGNHEYLTPDAEGYFSYFGAAAGDPTKGYYSYNLGSWHIVVINSNCSKVGGCGPNSPQVKWLEGDLAENPAKCTLAYWHHPRFSSGEHGDNPYMKTIWQDLYNAGVDIVLNGHDHDYERFAPMDGDGNADPNKGIREFVVGTGGKNYYPFSGKFDANSDVHAADVFGLLKLTLNPGSYSWQFLPEPGKSFSDSGSGTCH